MINLEQLPLEVFERCVRALPTDSLATLLQLSQTTRALVLRSIEISFIGTLSKHQKREQSLALEVARASPFLVNGRSALKFSHFTSTNAPSSAQEPLRYARFRIEPPIDISLADPDTTFIFSCSLSWGSSLGARYRHQHGPWYRFREFDDEIKILFEDLCEVEPDRPISVDPDGLIVNTARPEEAVLRLVTVDCNMLKVLKLLRL